MSTHIDISPNSFGYLTRLYSQTNSSTPITATVSELSLLDGGVGSKVIPANGFQVGDSFRAVLIGHISSANNETLRIRVKAGSIVLADTLAMTLPATASKHWKLEIDFTILQQSRLCTVIQSDNFTPE